MTGWRWLTRTPEGRYAWKSRAPEAARAGSQCGDDGGCVSREKEEEETKNVVVVSCGGNCVEALLGTHEASSTHEGSSTP